MQIVDTDAAVDLAIGVVRQAQRDAKRGDGQAADFLAWMQQKNDELSASIDRLDARIDAMNGNGAPKAQAKAQAPAPATLSADEISERVRQLTDMGVGYHTAKLYADPAKLADHERMQRRRELAGRLGVSEKFLPKGIEDEN